MDDVEGLRWRSFVVVWWRSSLVEVFLNNGIVVSKVGKVIENKKKKTYLETQRLEPLPHLLLLL